MRKSVLFLILLLNIPLQAQTIDSPAPVDVIVPPINDSIFMEGILSEFTITASRPIYKLEDGGISIDIQNSRLKDRGNAADVLAQLPMITKDKTTFTVFGKGIPLIYINNRLVRDMSELEELNSANIKKVTVITNPGAEYDATVQSVIKIETIKTAGDGLSGNTTGKITIDKKFHHYELANLNYRRKNLDIFGMFLFGQFRDLQDINLQQSLDYNSVLTEVKQKMLQNSYTKRYHSNLGFNYSLPEEQSIGMKYEGRFYPIEQTTLPSEIAVFKNNRLKDQFPSLWEANANETKHRVNAYYQGTINDWLSAKLDMDYAIGSSDKADNTTNYRPDATEYISTGGRQDYNLFAVKLNLTTPAWDGQLTYGGEYSYTHNKQQFDVNEAGNAENLKSDNNTAKQNLSAVFLMYNKKIGHFSADLGLRYENIHFDYFVDQEKMNEQSKIYNNFFPAASISYSGKLLQMMLGFRTTTYRPGYYELRNSLQYDNPYTYESGNPYLKPAITQTLSYLLKWRDLQISANYEYDKDRIMFISELYSDDIVLMRLINFDKTQNFSASTAYTPTFGIWKPSIELNVFKNFITYGLPATTYNQPVYQIAVKNNVLLFNDLQLSIDIDYSTKGNMGTTYIMEDVFSLNVYLSKSFFNDRLRINLQGTDLFDTDRQHNRITLNEISTIVKKNLNMRAALLSVTYRFNATESKYKGEKASDELDRL